MKQIYKLKGFEIGIDLGIFEDDTVYLVTTPTVSKEFKTLKGAIRFLNKRNVKIVKK